MVVVVEWNTGWTCRNTDEGNRQLEDLICTHDFIRSQLDWTVIEDEYIFYVDALMDFIAQLAVMSSQSGTLS